MLHALRNSLEAYMAPKHIQDAVISVPTRLSDIHSTLMKQIVQDVGLLATGPFSPRAINDLIAETVFNSSFLDTCGWDPVCDMTEVVLVLQFGEDVFS
jgi:hypothetical protein